MAFLFPIRVVEFYRGHLAPDEVEQPTLPLYFWVLQIETISPPSEEVRKFFSDHEVTTHKSRNVWVDNGSGNSAIYHQGYGRMAYF